MKAKAFFFLCLKRKKLLNKNFVVEPKGFWLRLEFKILTVKHEIYFLFRIIASGLLCGYWYVHELVLKSLDYWLTTQKWVFFNIYERSSTSYSVRWIFLGTIFTVFFWGGGYLIEHVFDNRRRCQTNAEFVYEHRKHKFDVILIKYKNL